MAEYEAVFGALRDIMLASAHGLTIAHDAPGDLIVRTGSIDPKTGEPGWFGTVKIKKSYVAYHLIPLYARPELADDLSDALTKRRQGKTCFNFRTVDQRLFDDLAALTVKVRAAIA